MSKQKTTISDVAKTPAAPAVRGDGDLAGAKAPEPKVVALQIDDNDFGGDPYNHTGSYCVLEFDKDD